MKRADMRTGTVYAYRQGTYGMYYPVVVLDTSQLYCHASYYAAWDTPSWRTASVGRCAVKEATGFLAVELRNSDDPQRLLEITLEDAMLRTKGSPSPEGVRFVAIDPRYIAGEWDTVIAEEKVRQAKVRESMLLEHKEREERKAEVARLSVELEDLGFDHNTFGPAYAPFQLSAETVRKLVDRLMDVSE